MGAHPRKLRPIALSEAPLKLVESMTIQEEVEATLRQVEPYNLGLGSPDGAALAVRALRAEAVRMAACNRATLEAGGDDLWAMVPLDLANAYGAAYRSGCLRAAAKVCPRLAAIAASEWQLNKTAVWTRVGGQWQQNFSARGGWQGSRAMQILFVVGLEASLT